jgi:eukaryotic-like serine/threonine-protein kinase
MNSERAQQSDTIFQAALDLKAEERAAYLDRACAGDVALRREVESLIAAYEQAGSFIERPAIEVDAEVLAGQKNGSLVGRVIQHYKIVRLLGEGGMGEVYLAEDTKLQRKVALKLLPADFASNQERMRRFVREARTASALNHPSIAHIYEIGEAEGVSFIAMEYVEGETLREKIHGGRTDLRTLLKYLAQVAEGLAKAHAAGIVHRDLKPDNVMVSRDGYAKVLDFGLAKLVEPREPGAGGGESSEAATRLMPPQPLSTPGAIMGTVGYMSPEQARGDHEVDQRSDIFSFGCVLFEAATRRQPFAGDSVVDTLHRIINAPAPSVRDFNADAPAGLQRVVRRCLQKDPEERYQSIKDVGIELKELRREMQGEAELHSSAAPPQKSSAAGDESATRILSAGSTADQPAAKSVEAVAAPKTSSAEYVVTRIKSHKKIFAAALLVALAALAVVGFGLYKLFGRGESARSGAPLKVTPLTSSPYIERNPALSPDGKQVAYVWTGEKGDNPDLYIKLIGAGEPLRLTNSPGFEMSPAFSPDGRYIAFLRGKGEGLGFYIIPALGGVERKLADAYEWTGGIKPQALDWSPDGRVLAVVDKTSEDEPWSIFLISVETGERRRLTTPPAGYGGDTYVSFSPDGSRLAFFRSHFYGGDIYTVPVAGGEPARVTSDDAVVYGLAWTRDGAELVFSSDRGGGGDPTLWRVPAAGGTPALVAGVGENVYELSIARQGDRLAYAQRSVDFNIYRLELTGQPGGRRGAGAPASFISSTRIEDNPQFSPDGHRVSFRSNRSGSDEIWACDAEGKNPVQLTNFGSHSAGARWSPDGRFIVFNSLASGNSDIYVVGADGGSPRRLTSDTSAEFAPSWSRDGRWIYFASNRTGRSEIWKMPAAGGAAIQLTRGGGQIPVESPDGRTVYYVRGRGESSLWQVSTEGGEETQVFEARVDPGNWAVAGRGIYFLTSQPRQGQSTLGFFDFATRQTTQITTLEGPMETFQISGLTVSPDEHRVLYAQRDKLVFNLMLVENFR